jgi:taurine transport system ATP-binding protein
MTGLLIQNLSIRFDQPDGVAVQTLQDVSLGRKAEDLFRVPEPSGCGKTIHLKIFASFLAPTSGHITLNKNIVMGPSSDHDQLLKHWHCDHGDCSDWCD